MRATLAPVRSELLEALAASAPSATARGLTEPTGERFDLDRWISEHGLDVVGPAPWQGGRRWIFRICPWNADHRNRSAYIVQLASGAIAAGCQHAGCAGRDWHALREVIEPGWRERRQGQRGSNSPRLDATEQGEDDEGPNAAGKRPSQADRLVQLAEMVDLFHDPTGDTYARAQIGHGWGCWPTRSKGFRRWLIREYYQRYDKAPSAQALTESLNVVEAMAQFDGACWPVYLRVAPDGQGGIYIDLGDSSWRLLHVTPEGWRLSESAEIRFRRSPGMLALPEPVRGGTLDEFRRFVNVADDGSWSLVKAWLRTAVRDRGPYPLLALYGEQGSAKTTLARMLRSLFDPALPDLRSDPRELRDLSIAARGSWLVAFDNVSHIQPWLSDALCRLATGGGWATRELYTDLDEVLFEARRPVLLTGITEYIVRGDLLDRALQVTLDPIPDDRRRDEKGLWAEFQAARPCLLGALLDDVVAALRTMPDIRLARLPRMADFSLWAVAAERGRGEAPQFLRAYADARGQSHELALEASVIGPTLLQFIDSALTDGPWQGNAAELLRELSELADDSTKRARDWPRTARKVSGELRRLAPALRGLHVNVRLGQRGSKGKRLVTLEKVGAGSSPPSPPSAPRDEWQDPGDAPTPPGDGRDAAGDGLSNVGDGGDDLAAAFCSPRVADSSDDWDEI
jgi:hypothetical protein